MLENKITTVIIYNDKKKLESLVEILRKIPEFLVVGMATTGKQGIHLVQTYLPQFVFVHIDLDDMNGLELVSHLNKKYINPEVAFIAENDEYAFSAMQFNPFDFMIFPCSEGDFLNMLTRLKISLKKKELHRKMDEFVRLNATPQKRILHIKRGIFIVEENEIVFCKADLTNSIVVLSNGDEQLVKTGISETIETLNNTNLIKVSRSFYINKNFLRKIERKNKKCILYSNKKSWEIPVSRKAIEQLESLNTSEVY